MLKEITHFFSIYKDLEGKRVEIKGWHDAAYARDRVVISVKQFQANKMKLAKAANIEAEWETAQGARKT
jgi:inorganic pyrophosphatase